MIHVPKTPQISSDKQQFTNHLITDLKTLERMIEMDLFEKGVTRIGAEQEFCLIDDRLRPSMKAMEILEQIDDQRFTTELARFNMEVNLDPLQLSSNCFSEMETDLVKTLIHVNKIAHDFNSKIILTGILPTIRKSDIGIEAITPVPRYKALNDAMLDARQNDFKFHINGLDELVASHDNVLFESCNTSFQVHYQVELSLAIQAFNWAHAIAGPVLAASCNSPIFMGKRLWRETRIALFHQSTDTRKLHHPMRKERSRVSFGYDWEKGSVLDLYREVAGRYKILLPVPIEEDSMQSLEKGVVPKLRALSVQNGTVYRWNRMCYGVTNGKPHLRIENRYIPAGPTIIDEVANAAFWVGLMHGQPEKYFNIDQLMEFDQAKNNFMTAAKNGLECQLRWVNNELYTAKDLIINELLPIARNGLMKAQINKSDIEKYLGIIEDRVKSGRTGAQWMVESFNDMKKSGKTDEALVSLTEGIYKRQKLGQPVHCWTNSNHQEAGGWKNRYQYVEQVMSRDLITIHCDDLLQLARHMMIWSKVHHLPVEDNHGQLCGILTSDQLLTEGIDFQKMTVVQVMKTDVITVTPESPTTEAYQIMKDNEIGSLPVVVDQKLVGIITTMDYIKLIGFFFEEMAGKE